MILKFGGSRWNLSKILEFRGSGWNLLKIFGIQSPGSQSTTPDIYFKGLRRRRTILDIYFENPGRQRMTPDSNFKGPGRQRIALDVNFKDKVQRSWTPKTASDFTLKIKEAETEFQAPISKLKEAETEFRAPISKVSVLYRFPKQVKVPVLQSSKLQYGKESRKTSFGLPSKVPDSHFAESP
ncbi:hypothetical protein RhiirA5_413478 [Rhizophagus irregularis]|uniref:Uncharacterized protein n=1 Tax=Rhizophagus irregularis TaxID=588596 RepID=A0A2N0PWB2_9GLOM|nr:hypothetical protein RhiirA5_413478 [Rhizophagus irregularis]